jgi:ribose 5-phosphate isomerase
MDNQKRTIKNKQSRMENQERIIKNGQLRTDNQECILDCSFLIVHS